MSEIENVLAGMGRKKVILDYIVSPTNYLISERLQDTSKEKNIQINTDWP
jgi:hypothetical protein